MLAGCPVEGDDTAQFGLDWTLTSGANTITCADANADTVEVLATHESGQGYSDKFDCIDMGAVTDPSPLGAYTVIVYMLQGETELAESLPRATSLDIAGDLVDLGVFNFDFAPANGNVSFKVDYGAAGIANCLGGAAIGNQNTNLAFMGDNMCIAGTTLQAGQDTYGICDEIPPCIESNVQQVLLDLPPDQYDLLIEGEFDDGGNTVVCYRHIETIDVAGDIDLGTILVEFDDSDDPGFCSGVNPAKRGEPII